MKTVVTAVLFVLLMLGGAPALWAENGDNTGPEGKTWTVNIRNADIQAFINQVADMTGKNFVVDPRVRARDVTVISRQSLTSAEVYELFLAVLQVHGYAAVTSGEIVKIVPNTIAKQANLPLTQRQDVEGEEMITRVIPIENSPVEELVPVLRPLVPQYGHLAAVSSANALIISDHADNIRRIEAILAHLDGAEAEELEIIRLEHAWVGDVVKVLESLTPEQQQQNRRRSPRESQLSMVADERTNRLILKGDSVARSRVVELVRELDVPGTQDRGIQVIRLNHADAEEMAELLKQFVGNAPQGENASPSGEVSIQADPSLNALVVRADPDVMQELKSIISQLDVRRAQILIEAAIIEVGGDNSRNLGFQWAAGDPETGVGAINFSNAGLSVNDVISTIVSGQPQGGLNDGITIGGGQERPDGSFQWGGFLQALASTSDVNLLSTPSVLTLDNQEASIIVGQNVPFVTGQSTDTGAGVSNPFQTIQREDVGITLTVTPSLAGNQTVRLVLDQEASSVQPSTEGVNSVDLITNKRSIKTTVLADNGETIVLGGLIQDDLIRSERKVPLLGDIPILGALFRSTSNSWEKRNLVLFLRPTILGDNQRLVDISRQRYLGITALQFRVNRRGDLERVVASPLPVHLDDIFSGRSGVPDDLQEHADEFIFPKLPAPQDEAEQLLEEELED